MFENAVSFVETNLSSS